MLRYALRRCAYSILIMLGVLMLTFALFRVAAGDPAAAVLGKNPTPEELESMRIKLGSAKPVFFGTHRETLAYPSADFTDGKTLPKGIVFSGRAEPERTENGLLLHPGEKLEFSQNFSAENVRAEITSEGTVPEVRFENGKCVLTNQSGNDTTLSKIQFTVPTNGPFDTQLVDSLKEIVSFHKEFPYVSFFNFGETLLTHESIRSVLWRGMGASLCLMLPVFFGEMIVGIFLAMLSAVFRGKFIDKALMFISVAGMSISYLALILFFQWFFGYYLNWFPVWGWGSVEFLFLPVLAGIVSGTGSGVRFYRTVFLNEMNKEYLRTAAAKGCSPTVIYFKHLFRNAAIPIITRASAILPYLFTGSLLLESFFGIPGLGYKGVDALNSSDLQMLKALVILGSFLFTGINLLADLAYAWADPRVRPQ